MRAPVSFLVASCLGLAVAGQAPAFAATPAASTDRSATQHSAKSLPSLNQGSELPGAAEAASANAGGAGAVSPACSAPKAKDVMQCFALRVDSVKGVKGLMATTAPAGLSPSDLASAYNLPANGGAGATIAIVDANDDPNAASDLAVYRQQYGLPALNAGQFVKVDQEGVQGDYPAADPGWSEEISLDLDMVSAVAPKADIILVEADSASFGDLGASVNEAVALGAGYVSNSYGSGYTSTPGSGESSSDVAASQEYYDHPGVAVVASSGDDEYGVAFPAASPYVTSVGGTSLVRDPSTARGWSETVWNSGGHGPGSGCSTLEPKPAFQHDTGCAMRTVADVSAVADPQTGVAVYDSYQASGWAQFGGTSAASPIIASVYADAGPIAKGTYPNSFPYAHTGDLNDVTSGSNGSCEPTYLCTAGSGYDGPTGLGTPNGTAAFASGPVGTLSGTITDASTGKPISGATVAVSGASSASTTTAPDGTYQLTITPGSYDVTVSAFDYTAKTQDALTVAANKTSTAGFALSAVPEVTVSGTVADASGHGWPLYAAIQVDNGIPGGPVYTDPATGRYSVRLPENEDYTLHTTANYPGYVERDVTVTTKTSNTVQNIGLTVDALPSVGVPPGYTQNTSGDTETFPGDNAPAGWSVSTATGNAWSFNPSVPDGTGGPGGFAAAEADFAPIDTSLTTSAITVPAGETPFVSFDTTFFGGTSDLDYSADGGKTWTTEWSQTTIGVGSEIVALPVSTKAAAAQVRFHYEADTASTGVGADWQVSDVRLGVAWASPQTGDLVVGNLTDGNTGKPLDGATVSVAGHPAQSALSAPMSGPAALGDGFYWFFSSLTGRQTITAADYQYKTASAKVDLRANEVTEADLAVHAGRLVTGGAVSATVPSKGSTTRDLTLTNTGDAAVTVKLDPFAGSTSGPAWSSVPGTPALAEAMVGGEYDGKVYAGLGDNGAYQTPDTFYSYDPGTGSWSQEADAPYSTTEAAGAFLDGKLYVDGGLAISSDYVGSIPPATQVYDPSSNTWSTTTADPHAAIGGAAAVLDGKLYVVGGYNLASQVGSTVSVFDPKTGKWSTAASYPEPVYSESCGVIAGELYCAGGESGTFKALSDAYVFNPAKDSWKRIAGLPFAVQGSAYGAADGQLIVSGGQLGDGDFTAQSFAYDPALNRWTPLPAAAESYEAVGVVGSAGFYSIGGAAANSVLAGYGQAAPNDVPWLSTNPTTLTVQPGRHATVRVRLNARDSGLAGPGTDTAALEFEANTPYAVGAVPVTMTVGASAGSVR